MKRPRIIAHRGASATYPENTMIAFRAAEKMLADGIELDLQLSLDQEVVVIHDYTLNRTTNGRGAVLSHTFAQLHRLDAGSWKHPRFHKARIPHFAEVCDFLQRNHLDLVIELKNFLLPQPGLEEKVLAMLEEYQLLSRTVISSFNFDSLRLVKQLSANVTTALLYVGDLNSPWELAERYGAERLHAPHDVITPQLITAAHQRGLQVYAWTVNERKVMQRMSKMGVDGLITDHPQRARNIQLG